MEKQIEEMAKIMLEESQKANVEPVLEIEGKEIVLGEIITKILDNILEQAFIPFLAEILYKQGYRKQEQGEWVKHSICGVPCDDFYRCKDCGYLALKPTRYCGNCGAKMKGN